MGALATNPKVVLVPAGPRSEALGTRLNNKNSTPLLFGNGFGKPSLFKLNYNPGLHCKITLLSPVTVFMNNHENLLQLG